MSYIGTEAYTGTSSTVSHTYPVYSEPSSYISYLYAEQFKREWAKFRTEFVRELLREAPQGIIDFKQNREWDSKHQVYRVKVELEYVPQMEKDVDRNTN